MVEPDRVEVRDRLVARDLGRLVDPVWERRVTSAEEVRRRRIEDPDRCSWGWPSRRRRGRSRCDSVRSAEVVDVVGRTEQAEFLAAEPDERSLFSGLTFFIFWAMSRIVAEPEALSSMPAP